jgi:hypothetical protein
MFFEFSLGLRTADFLFSIRHIASNTVHRDILSLGLLRSLWFVHSQHFNIHFKCVVEFKRLFIVFL